MSRHVLVGADSADEKWQVWQSVTPHRG